MSFQAILLLGHGSKKKEGIQGLVELAGKMQKRHDDITVDYAFLELAQPTYYEAIKKLYDKGIRKIMAIPVFLFAGVHVNYEIPEMLKKYQREMNGLEISMVSNIGVNDELVQLAEKRIIEADYAHYGKSVDHTNDLLFNIGIGSSVPAANANTARLARLIWEKTGFAFSEYAFISKLTFPSVSETLQIIKPLPFERVVVFPMLLFPGLFLDRVFMSIEEFRKEVNKEVIFAEPFGPDELMVDILDRKMLEVREL